jgi:hypothetical protein
MPDSFFRTLDPDEAASFRQWARENYKRSEGIDPLWHPVIREECARIDEKMRPEVDAAVENLRKLKQLLRGELDPVTMEPIEKDE